MRLLAPASLALCATTQRLLTADSASAPIPPSIPPPLTIANSPAEVSTVFEAKQTRQLGLSRLPNPPVAQMERSSSSSQATVANKPAGPEACVCKAHDWGWLVEKQVGYTCIMYQVA
ncbi:hypothetical protein M440DRAFT_1185295 [Trichoderma longibrachiatum ATCC 18648]|uniref:Uncharacterized protein n=1 Tax=Trichoderma longibrachiatum ATCC 18648 TaxID=983965 RepID=A0A2T4C970_TRILO|nr:hypothetical protein M440DRAFT_1185295 [Trichoderma longibrachiatum ATCC 18648]